MDKITGFCNFDLVESTPADLPEPTFCREVKQRVRAFKLPEWYAKNTTDTVRRIAKRIDNALRERRQIGVFLTGHTGAGKSQYCKFIRNSLEFEKGYQFIGRETGKIKDFEKKAKYNLCKYYEAEEIWELHKSNFDNEESRFSLLELSKTPYLIIDEIIDNKDELTLPMIRFFNKLFRMRHKAIDDGVALLTVYVSNGSRDKISQIYSLAENKDGDRLADRLKTILELKFPNRSFRKGI